MKSKKGFTLIELLAIIVILAIIALITVPIILGIIDNSKKGAVKDSAYGYKDAVQKFYVNKAISEPNYVIPDGTYMISDLETLGVSVNGDKPDSNSWLHIEKNSTIAGCLQYDEYNVVITGGDVGNAVKGECDEPGPSFVLNEDLTSYPTLIATVYLDPTMISNSCNADKAVSDPGTKSGCMKWYVYDEFDEDKDGNGVISDDEHFFTMILDHNTTSGVAWWTRTQSAGNAGPKNALYQLYEDTKNWNSISYVYESYTPSDDVWPFNGGSTKYTIDYSKHLASSESLEYVDGACKARFMSWEEATSITGVNSISSTYYFDGSSNTRRAGDNKYGWLFDNLNNCENYGCNRNASSNSEYRFWLGTISYSTASEAASISLRGNFNSINTNNYSTGIRPVITVSKSALGID